MKFHYIPRENLEKLPKDPGVYALAGPEEILYIGKAQNIKERVKNHFSQSSYRDHLFRDKVKRVGYIPTQSDIDALLLESSLIKKLQPKYNVMWRDDKGYFYVGITKEPLPRVFISHQIRNKSPNTKYQILNTRYIGPFVDGRALRQVLRMLRRAFPFYTQTKHSAKPCQWCHLGLCPGPNPDKQEYKKNIAYVAAVFAGKRKSVARNIEKAMNLAAQAQNFEKAAQLRDQLFALERIVSHTPIVLPLLQHNYHDAQKTLQSIFKTKKPIVRIEAYDISNIQGQEATGSMVTFLGGKPAKAWYRKFKIRISGKPNDFAMMQELVSRRLKHREWPYPDLMVIDGGKPQLSATLEALHKSAIRNPQFAIVALAKRHNELFLPSETKPIPLKTLPRNIQNLILHIRDEAHRFAISYHRKLRKIDLLGRA
ncbi:MAG: GIY-YIG nuclease family protein [Candidatus Wildermuthbacteria bacterium]|nr:GIY-YIG nuclease family protein [Candidatus Wildermuthbacteria bacterium]